MRHNDQVTKDFDSFLQKIGDGTQKNTENLGEDVISIPPYLKTTNNIAESIYGEYILPEDMSSILNRVILTTTNKDCHSINNEIHNKLSGNCIEYSSTNSIVEDGEKGHDYITEEYLNSIDDISSLPPHILKLKINTVVMLIRSLNKKLCNGTRLLITGLGKYIKKYIHIL